MDAPTPGRTFAPVVERTVEGDLLFAGSSNLPATDVDGDTTRICAGRAVATSRRRICADNSSSTELSLPAGARVIAARLYVETTVAPSVRPLRVSLDGPGTGYSYRTLAATPTVSGAPAATADPAPAVPKLYEATAGAGRDAVLRQAVWDLTDYVTAAGPGTYTVADIVSQRVIPSVHHASWAIVVAYERDPAVALDTIDASARARFAPRLVSWHDGFQHVAAGSFDVAIGGLDLATDVAPFGRTFHVVVGGRAGRSDNLLFDGRPLGNNNTPGDAPAPADVIVGSDPTCNTITDVQNGSVCMLGTQISPVAGVDMDVIRIPDAHLRAAGTEATLRLQLTGGETLTPGVIAVSIDISGGTR